MSQDLDTRYFGEPGEPGVPKTRNGKSLFPVGKFACRYCRHDVAHHNLEVGCPDCTCMGTPGEVQPRTDAELAFEIYPPSRIYGNHQIRTPQDPVEDPRVARAQEIAEQVSSGKYIGGHGGIHPSTRKIAKAVALEAARIALGLPAREPRKPF